MRGRKPSPTKLKLLKGNPGKRPINANEPKPEARAPRCPRWLSKEAKAEWKRVVPELARLGLLTIVDRAALVGYCESWAEYRQAREYLIKAGPVYPLRDDKGEVKYLAQVPQVSIANKALANVRAFCAEFGLTPSARSRMSIPGKPESADGMEAFFRGG